MWKYVLSVKNEKKASCEKVRSKAESSHFQQDKRKTHQWWKMIMWSSQATWAWTQFEVILGKDLPQISEKKAISFWILFVKKIHGLYIYKTKPLITTSLSDKRNLIQYTLISLFTSIHWFLIYISQALPVNNDSLHEGGTLNPSCFACTSDYYGYAALKKWNKIRVSIIA